MGKYFINRQLLKSQVLPFVINSKTQKKVSLFILTVLKLYLFIGLTFYFVYWLVTNQQINYFLYCLPVFILLIGSLQYIIAQAAHEAIHFYIEYNDKTWAGLICACLVLYPIGVTKNFKKNHMMHHIHFGDLKKDPDQMTFMNYPTTKIKFWFWLLESFSGISTVKRIGNLLFINKEIKNKQIKPQKQKELRFEFIKLLLTQVIIFFVFFGADMWWSYFILWIYPLTVVTKTLINIRLLAEHSPFDCTEPALRSFIKKDWSTKLLGVFGFQHHAEHHIFPGVSCNNLKNITEILRKNATENQESPNDIKIELLNMSYIQFLMKFYSSLPTCQLKELNDEPI